MEPDKSTSKITTKRRGNPQNLMPPWKPGQSGNPAGRKLGQRDRKTIIMEAIKRIAEKRKLTPEEVEEALQVAGLERAFKGSFQHFAAMSDGLYGKVPDKLNLTGRTIADLIKLAHGKAKPGAEPTAEV